jgi:hypothetical protein
MAWHGMVIDDSNVFGTALFLYGLIFPHCFWNAVNKILLYIKFLLNG